MQPDREGEQRAAQRFAVALPITMEGEEGGFTHELSAGGVLFEWSSPPEVGAHVSLSLEYEVDGVEFQVPCDGRVVRVERHGDNYNVAVRLRRPLFGEPD